MLLIGENISSYFSETVATVHTRTYIHVKKQTEITANERMKYSPG